MSKKPSYLYTMPTTIAGIPCKIGIEHYHKQEPFMGSALNCWSRDDYYGYTECDWNVLDRKGYAADWLYRKLTDVDRDRIEGEIEEYFEDLADDY